jgi:hypothetical protein
MTGHQAAKAAQTGVETMAYRIQGLPPEDFAHLRGLSDEELARHGARRVIAQASRGFPCRITLEDASQGEPLILLHHVSHDVATPYRSAYAIYVREHAREAAEHVDTAPRVFAGRPLGLRGFAADGMMVDARLALPGEADAAIRAMFSDPAIAYIDAHNAAHGCFAARIERHEGGVQ